jgi:uncharacterized protein (TIGR02646 family)
VIPVAPADEPGPFDSEVRQPGLQWLQTQGVATDQPPPDPAALPPYWRRMSRELWGSYAGVCAYLCIYFEWSLGAHSTDHFIAKSRHAGRAYEWANYRLSCLGANRNKNRFDDILDPFGIAAETFVLNLLSGEIKPNPDSLESVQQSAQQTIDRLKLDDPETNNMRARHYEDYRRGDVSGSHLRRHSPFVWYEAQRQGLL